MNYNLHSDSHKRNCPSFVWIGVLLGLLSCMLITACEVPGINATTQIHASAPSANLAVDFISSLDTQNYDKAWADLGPPITLHSQSKFTQAAQTADSCYGIVTDYKLIDSNTSVSSDSKTWTYGSTITRSKLPHPYTLTLTIQEDAQGNWQVTAYSNGSTTTNDLGPANTPCRQ